MSEVKLKPCPFCQAIPQGCYGDWVINHANNCYFSQRYAQEAFLANKRTIEQWNTRHDSCAELVEALKELYECSKCKNGCAPDDMTCASNKARVALTNYMKGGNCE